MWWWMWWSLNMNEKNNLKSNEYIPNVLHLQWHITQRCNLRCTHCYQEGYSGKELSFLELLKVVDQFKDALKYFSLKAGRKIRGHITITGGEPFVRKDFFNLLEVFAANNMHFSFSILTNGTLINEEIAERLKLLDPSYVQISIEGTKKTHDLIRGVGSYEKALNAMKCLVKEKISVLASFTSHKFNYKEFSDVVSVCKKIGVNRVWSDRIIPCGSGEGMSSMMLSPTETKEFFLIMKKEAVLASKEPLCKTEVAMHRALQFLCGGVGYTCQAGKTLITLDSNGDLYPCRRMPIKIGNILEDNFINVYSGSHEIVRKLRDDSNCAISCKSCKHFDKCKGGLRCLSYAVTKNPFEKDPGCWV